MELRLGPERLCGRSADRKNCELFGATARGQPVQPTLDTADVAWGVRCGVGARRDGSSSSFYFVHSMPAGIKWPVSDLDPDPIWFVGALLEGSRTLEVLPLPGGTAGVCDEAMDRDASRPLPFNLPSGKSKPV